MELTVIKINNLFKVSVLFIFLIILLTGFSFNKEIDLTKYKTNTDSFCYQVPNIDEAKSIYPKEPSYYLYLGKSYIGFKEALGFKESRGNYATTNGNKMFEGNTYVENNALAGSELTFTGTVTTNTLAGNGQLLFSVNNGPLEGGHQAIPAQFGGAFTTTALTEDAVLVTDENSDPDENDACDPVTNGGDLNGTVAVVRRGACEFGFKALQAQNAGAVAVIVVNNVEGPPIIMAGGADGESVTIPVLMVSDVVGEAIIGELSNGVNTTMVLSDYTTTAFIKVFNSDYSVLKQESVELGPDGTDFSVTYDNVEDADAVVQYGFQVFGLNANPVNEAALGSVVITSDVLSVNDVNMINVSIYPNPTSNNINIQSEEQITNVVIYNTLGQTVRNVSPDATNFSVNTSNLDAGTYFAVLSTENASKTVKFIKK